MVGTIPIPAIVAEPDVVAKICHDKPGGSIFIINYPSIAGIKHTMLEEDRNTTAERRGILRPNMMHVKNEPICSLNVMAFNRIPQIRG